MAPLQRSELHAVLGHGMSAMWCSGQWKEEHRVGPAPDGYEQSSSKFVRLFVAVNTNYTLNENNLIIVARESTVQMYV